VSGDLGRIQTIHWALVAVATGIAFVAGAPGPGGVALGGAVMGLSVAAYVVLFDLVVRGGRRHLAIGLLFAKVAAFLGLGWLAFASGSGRPDPIGFALGVICFPTAAVCGVATSRKG
jgi:hypothetical protein